MNTHFEYLESIGQMNIFDFLPITPSSKRNNGFMEGDRVKIRYYVDEIDYIEACHPQLLGEGIVIGKQHDFYEVKFVSGETVEVTGEKLILVVSYENTKLD